MKLLAGNSNSQLSSAIARVLDVPLTKANIRRFADNEVFVVIEENVRGEDVFVIQSTSYPANDNLMELLICIDALARASARRITAVMPYFGYARQDRKTGGRTPISAKLVANLITRAGADRVLTMEMSLRTSQYDKDVSRLNFWQHLVERVRALPGVESVALGTAVSVMDVPELIRMRIRSKTMMPPPLPNAPAMTSFTELLVKMQLFTVTRPGPPAASPEASPSPSETISRRFPR